MEDAKLISLCDTLKMLAPKGKVGGLGPGARGARGVGGSSAQESSDQHLYCFR